MKKFKIEYTTSESKDLQIKEIEAENIDVAKAKFRFLVKGARIWYVKEVKDKITSLGVLKTRLDKTRKGVQRSVEYDEKKELKHAKNEAWKLKHPDGKRKHRKSQQ